MTRLHHIKQVTSRRLLTPAFALTFLISTPALAERTDEVVLANGNAITGEVKELVQGKLKYKTDDIGTIYIEWEKVAGLSSNSFFDIETQMGVHYFGALGRGPEPKKLVVIGADRIVTLEMDQVINIIAIRKTFWGRVDGALNLGFSFTSADSILQYSLEADATYRTKKYSARTKLSSIQTQQVEKEDIARNSLEFSFTRYRKRRYFGAGALEFSSNTELGIDFRTQLKGTFGRHFVQTNRTRLAGAMGLAVSREKPVGEEPNDHYLSGVFSGNYHFFLFNYPKTDILVDLVVMPGITDWPRTRIEFNASIRREIITNFTVNFSAYDSFDSDPPTEGTTTHDYGVILSVGWTF
ncbi:MAG: DUF481 domain-containing protein [Thermoanaerobaculales bacterium]